MGFYKESLNEIQKILGEIDDGSLDLYKTVAGSKSLLVQYIHKKGEDMVDVQYKVLDVFLGGIELTEQDYYTIYTSEMRLLRNFYRFDTKLDLPNFYIVLQQMKGDDNHISYDWVYDFQNRLEKYTIYKKNK